MLRHYTEIIPTVHFRADTEFGSALVSRYRVEYYHCRLSRALPKEEESRKSGRDGASQGCVQQHAAKVAAIQKPRQAKT